MPIRITGMNSGLDTETIISELVKAKSTKKDNLVKAQTKLQWKQDAWKELNSKVYSLYSKTLSNLRLKSDYYKKTTKVSNDTAATVITGANAVNGVQNLEIKQLAKTGYLTGAKLGDDVTSSTTLQEMFGESEIVSGKIRITVGDTTKSIEVNGDTKISDVVSQLKSAGLNASFDEKNKRFFVSSKETGAAGDFSITAQDAGGLSVLNKLGVSNSDEYLKYVQKDADGNYVKDSNNKYVIDDSKLNEISDSTARDALKDEILAVVNTADFEANTNSGATRILGQDAKILLNGAEFESNNNTFEINGLTITANAETTEPITLTTSDDTDGIYDMIKGFLKEYNELINEMDKLYNADSSRGYEPLTDDEKEAMSETEIEKWEETIKNSLLRRDSTLSTVSSAMKQVMSSGIKIGNDTVYLSDFGISTLNYFSAKENERNAYHIDGDPDDSSTNTNADKLKTAIANDPDKVIEFFSSLTMNLYNKLGSLMKKTEYSSSFTLYDDIAMKDEYNDYTTKITEQENKITEFEDRYYEKFTAMETAMAKMNSKQSAISSLLGV